MEVNAQKILDKFNKCLGAKDFPTLWKEAKIALIPKGDPEEATERRYRPIGLIDILGKILEALILNLLKKEIEDKEDISAQQGGTKSLKN